MSLVFLRLDALSSVKLVSSDSSPENISSADDRGDEIARRFAYQWSYAAIIACGGLDSRSTIAEVFCEHHEDILVKLRTGKFIGIQVKTRQTDGDPFRASDEQVAGAVAKFAKLEHLFSSFFDQYRLATNHHFVSGRKNGTCLPYLIELATQTSNVDAMQAILDRYVGSVARRADVSHSDTLSALKKTVCDASLPKLENIKQELCDAIHESYMPAREATLGILRQAANRLEEEAGRAARLDPQNLLPRYLTVSPSSLEDAERRKIDGKRLTVERVRGVLDAVLTDEPILRPGVSEPATAIEGRTRLEKKLNAGGLSVVSINAAKDLDAAALSHYLKWQNKFGPDKARERYGHVKAIVLQDSATAYEAKRTTQGPFGRAMLDELRGLLRARRRQGGATLFDCLDEHLEGFAYELTNACKVWWSDPFPVDDD